MLVHLDSSELLEQYGLIGVDFDPSLIRTVEPSAWPRHWRSDPAPAQIQSIRILPGRASASRWPFASILAWQPRRNRNRLATRNRAPHKQLRVHIGLPA